MFDLMRNFYKWLMRKNGKEITLALLGVDNAGKSTILSRLKGGTEKNTLYTHLLACAGASVYIKLGGV